MVSPLVTFVVPCYKLAHFLPDCLNSILGQTFRDLEVLVMDDHSPDNTADVVRSFQDHRVRYIRNDRNLGPLPNYNKGIGMSRAKYVWLISADDYLRRPYVLERYVEVMDRHARVGYAFCPGVGVKDGTETGVLDYSTYGERDLVVSGHSFMSSILRHCFVLAPSALVRRECYTRLGGFPTGVVWAGDPIDLVWGGDWYLWALFAMHFDVAYFAEPMVCYREHGSSSSDHVTQAHIEKCVLAEIAVPWMLKQKADEAGFRDVARQCLKAIASEYANHLLGQWYRSGTRTMSMEEFEASLARNKATEAEKRWIRARALAGFASGMFLRGERSQARRLFHDALGVDPWMLDVQIKRLLLRSGFVGEYLWKGLKPYRADQ
jgi:glycosyltransferase involved in cell wall biosynthesis